MEKNTNQNLNHSQGQDQPDYNWDLSHLYRDLTDWENDYTKIQGLAKDLAEEADAFIRSAPALLSFLDRQEEMEILLTRLYVYAKASFDVDMKNQEQKKLFEKADGLQYKIMEQLAFVQPALLTLQPEQWQEYREQEPGLSKYAFMFEKLFKQRAHVLDTATEQLLSGLDSVASFFEKAYDDLTIGDMEYPQITDPDTGKSIPANNTSYYVAMLHPQRQFRKSYFQKLLGTYQKHEGTLTSLYYGSVKKNVLEARQRRYHGALNMALSSNFIEEGIYDNLVETVGRNCHVLQEYLAYRKAALEYENLHFYDLFIPLASGVSRTYTFEEAREIVLSSLNPLGQEYQEIVDQAFREKWLDVFPKENKTSGAYAIGVYDRHPYSLLNFTGTLQDLFTITHELGHVMHSYYSSKSQSYTDSGYSIFCAEVASTVNEQLLYHYLLENAESQEETRYLLNTHLDSIRSTFFRQTLFAEFEKECHQLVEKEQPLTPEELQQLYVGLYQKYYGPDFVIDPELASEWARIPHFYAAFYVYQYATGISAAIALADQILNDPEYDIKRYFRFLKSGGSDYPVQQLRDAGADMAKPESVEKTIQDFQATLERLQKLG